MYNQGLARLHLVLLVIYVVIGVFVTLMASDDYELHAMAPVFAGVACAAVMIHALARKGAKLGANWGRRLSQAIGVVMLIGFPIGTAVGWLILFHTQDKWSGPVEQSN